MLGWLFPPHCAVCTARLSTSRQPLLCRDCRDALPPLPHPRCQRCLTPFASAAAPDHLCGQCLPRRVKAGLPRRVKAGLQTGGYDQLFALGAYAQPWPQLIHNLKFGKQLHIAPILGSLLAEYAEQTLDAVHYDCIVPVPLHGRTLRRRGFNQAEQLARLVGRRLQIRCDRLGLEKAWHTPEQARLNHRQRLANLHGTYRARRTYHGEACLLIDDVLTTGATVENCARTLKQAGALRVDVLTLTRTL